MGATPSFDMVLFGGTGDLAMRKLLPALYQAHQSGTLHPAGRIVALGRGALTLDDYLAQVRTQSGPHLKADFSSPVWTAFAARITYLKLDAARPADFDALADLLGKGGERVTVCYLATAPSLFADICAQLARVGLNHPDVRVVLEKPLGHDLDSSDAINAAVAQSFAESQLYRIDHYLGKESVQNLMAMRFGNVLFEPLWRREWVDNVQITIAEDLGVEGRGEFYDKTGALRDMVQNHLLQLLCMVAMEPPASLQADAIRDEKLKV
ncbi:MAG TPA: glucose-6-phosphate dehydrogenase, partial [Thiomonas arsenitoxydans]|nr:glucose-6-phosphate dehydrogenase [Thiomonas arsenitoxydans]